MTAILWFRRDLRLEDHPALTEAAAAGPVLGLFVIDPVLWSRADGARRAWVAASVQALAAQTGGTLVVRYGDPAQVVPQVAAEVGASAVHLTRETTPYGLRRDRRVAAALDVAGVARHGTGTPYAVDPGTVRTQAGSPFQVFTPFARAWREHGWEQPLPVPDVTWATAARDAEALALLDAAAAGAAAGMPTPGSAPALERWRRFLDGALADYGTARDLPGIDGTSRMSPYLKVGAVHPRQLLADLGSVVAAPRLDKLDDRGTALDDRKGPLDSDGAAKYAAEIAWREFYADVLWHQPASAWSDLRPLGVPYDDDELAVRAWQEGRTGYPIVDAGMRQLLHEGWMHNRVRMITASFLTKDLHAWWPVGARWFLDRLVDGDVASNSHGWQWVAGTGTDASPYFRVFNPVTQGKKFDPDGDYVRRWIPELAHLPGAAAHEPWKHPLGYQADYPQPVVDHAAERAEALARYAARPSGKDSSTS